MEDLLLQFEDKVNSNSNYENLIQQERITHYKFGVLNCKEGQTDENAIYSNTEISDDYREFLEFIGTKVELQEFPGYAAGLDTKRN